MLTRSVPTILVLWCSTCFAAENIPSDYKSYLEAVQYQAANRHGEAIRKLSGVWQCTPVSPLNGKASTLAARSYLASQRPNDALEIMRQHYDELPQPEGDLLLGQAAEASRDRKAASAWYAQVYYRFPLSAEAAVAEAGLVRVGFPPAGAEAVLARAEKLRKAGQAARARRELLAAAPRLSGPERDLATVRANFGDYRGLRMLTVASPEADAERIYLMHSAARRNSQEADAEAALLQLQRKYPRSSWTLEALVSWGNHFLLRNDELANKYFRKCYEGFPSEPQAPGCHWRVAWSSWMRRDPNAQQLMEEHAAMFPESEKAAAALYFSGQYGAVMTRSPMSWYAVLARQKSTALPVLAVRPDPSVFTPSETVRIRIGRAKQLETANMPEWAEFELKYAAQEQPFVAAIELAETAARRGAPHQGLRYIKSVARGYLSLPFEAAPERFWKLAFPLPWRRIVSEYSRISGLDPNLVTALIRQESEFNPNAVSRARALGLTQVLPSTGRQLSRDAGMGSFEPAMLFDPEVNVRLGTQYLRMLLKVHAGREEQALAAYNAGKGRVDKWSTWYEYREPAEFIESIPFTETREYVQVVLRNAEVYRRLYGR